MRYLAVCCLVMLAIAATQAFPNKLSLRHQLVSKVKAKTRTNTASEAHQSLRTALRNLKAKSSQRKLQHHFRQAGDSSEEGGVNYNVESCQDICDFETLEWSWLWLSEEEYGNQIEATFNCAIGKAWELEQDIGKEYNEATGEDLMTEEEVGEMWEIRFSETMSLDERVEKEFEWDQVAYDRYKDAGIEMSEELTGHYVCIRYEIYSFLYAIEAYEEYEK